MASLCTGKQIQVLTEARRHSAPAMLQVLNRKRSTGTDWMIAKRKADRRSNLFIKTKSVSSKALITPGTDNLASTPFDGSLAYNGRQAAPEGARP